MKFPGDAVSCALILACALAGGLAWEEATAQMPFPTSPAAQRVATDSGFLVPGGSDCVTGHHGGMASQLDELVIEVRRLPAQGKGST